jgi:hypothetical protein
MKQESELKLGSKSKAAVNMILWFAMKLDAIAGINRQNALYEHNYLCASRLMSGMCSSVRRPESANR